MNIMVYQIRSQQLLKIKKIIDKDINGSHFIIARRFKNIEFMREYGLNEEDVKSIIRKLSVEDCFAGPEEDRNSKYEGWIFKFNPKFEDTQLYVKIRIENIEKTICLSVHEFGKI